MPSLAKPLKHIFFGSFLFLFSVAAFASEPVPAKIVGVSDGDTVTAVINGAQVKIRLYGIDAPEKAQPFGQAATDVLKQITTGQSITIQAFDHDRYGRTVGMVFADGTNVNSAMVKSGHAWVYRQYCSQPFCNEWIRYEQAAKSAHAGLWKDSAPVAPWEWRHGAPAAKIDKKNVPTDDDAETYTGNVSTRKFHSSDCRYADCKRCTATFSSRAKAIAAGYSPCKVCNP